MGVVRGKMETLFHILISTCLAFGISGGFLIIHEQKQQCIYESNKTVYVGACNLTSINQQWRWVKNEKLLHVRSGQCLAISRFKAAHSRKAITTDCSEAPSWTCHSKEGLLEVKNSFLFLKKQGSAVVVKMGRKYLHSWKRIDVSKKGETLHDNLCSRNDFEDAETFVRTTRNTAPTLNSITHSPRNVLGTSSTVVFLSNVTESSNRNMGKVNPTQNVFELSETPWIPTTTHHFSTTKEQNLRTSNEAKFKTNKRKYFTQHIVKLWNMFPQEIVMATNLDGFQRGLNKSMEDKAINGY